jgi:hypothetical protein
MHQSSANVTLDELKIFGHALAGTLLGCPSSVTQPSPHSNWPKTNRPLHSWPLNEAQPLGIGREFNGPASRNPHARQNTSSTRHLGQHRDAAGHAAFGLRQPESPSRLD